MPDPLAPFANRVGEGGNTPACCTNTFPKDPTPPQVIIVVPSSVPGGTGLGLALINGPVDDWFISWALKIF